MRRLHLITIVSLLLLAGKVSGQHPGPHYRQFFFNPYLSNPAFVAINNSLEANLVYRQQWTGFKDAPVTMGANVQFPASNRVAVGFNIFTDKQVLLRNSNFMTTFGYVVPVAENQSLRFALSGGVGMNKLDLTAEELNTSDPAVLNASGNNWYVDGNFGMVYTNRGLRLGFALTDLFKSNTFQSESGKSFEFSNLKNRLFSASYKFNVTPAGTLALEPYFLYRQTEDGLQDAWEAAAMAYFKDILWTGVSYRQYSGIALFLGLNLKEKFRFSYSYEFPPTRSGLTSGSSHELHLGIKLRSKKSLTTTVRTTRPVPANERNTAGPPPEKATAQEVVEDTTVSAVTMSRNMNPEKNTPAKEETVPKDPMTPAGKTMESFTMTAGHYYVVVGVYRELSHSMKFSKEMISQGYPVNVALNPRNNQYYVYLHSSTDEKEAMEARNEFKRKNLLKEAWVYTP